MNRFFLFCILIVIIPTQILLTYLIKNDDTSGLSLHQIAINSIGDSADTVYNRIQSTLLYYTTYNHFKELFVVPYIPKKKKQTKIRKLVLKDTRTGIKVTAVETDEDYDENSELTKTGTNKIATGSHPSNDKSNSMSKTMATQNQPGSPYQPGANPYALNDDTSFAKEVEKYNEEHVYFARSAKPRTPRPSSVTFKVGDVVRHTLDGYHGVIIGWDVNCKAPEKWAAKHGYLHSGKEHLLNQPHYLVLAESKDKGIFYYLPQSHLILDSTTKVRSPKLSKYFDLYSTSDNKYHPKPWLRDRYPDDD